MKKLFLTALLFLAAINTQSKEILVSPHGKIRSVKHALQLADSGDIIRIASGTYREGNIIVRKTVEIIGEKFPVFDAEFKSEVLTVKSSRTKISGIKCINSGSSNIYEMAGIKIDSADNVTIENCQIENNFFGIYFSRSNSVTARNNKISANGTTEANSGNGIHIFNCQHVFIDGNKISGHRDGIYLEFSKDGDLKNNLSEKNIRYGLHFMFSDRNKYYQNIFRKNGSGVAVMYTKNIEMRKNIFEDNWGAAAYGLLLKDISHSTIEENIFRGNTVGIHCEGSGKLYIHHNDFLQNGWAVRHLANSQENNVSQNNFSGNTFDVATNGTRNSSTFDNNFWSSYSGYDLDKNGKGDVPFRPVRLFSYIIEKNPPAIILLNSFFVGLLELAEKIIPIVTPETLIDNNPSMQRIQW